MSFTETDAFDTAAAEAVTEVEGETTEVERKPRQVSLL